MLSESKNIFFIVAVLAFGLPNVAKSATFNAALNVTNPIEVESKDVVLQDAEHFITPDRVRINYKFHNVSDKKTNVVMAYKFPQIRTDYMHKNIYRDVQVQVNGERANISESRKASIDGKDVTASLKKAGLFVPLDACLRGDDKKFIETAKALSIKQKNELLSAGVDIDNILKGDCWLPWDLEISFNWTVTFDADETIDIQQSYSPNLTSYSIPLISDKIKQEYCINEESYKAISNKIGFGKMYPYFFEESLSVAKNWKGNIDRLKIAAESKKVGSYVFGCLPNLDRKTEFEISSEQFNIEPKDDIKILFLLKN
jgi:hypothetical protein